MTLELSGGKKRQRLVCEPDPLLKKLRAGLNVCGWRLRDSNTFMTKVATSNRVEGSDKIKMSGNDLTLRVNEGDIKLIFGNGNDVL